MTSPCVAHGCSLCCMDTEMPLAPDDVARLAGLGHDPAAFSARGPDGVVHLRTREPAEGQTARPCYFLHEGRCSVYADRPAGCRIYPFVLTLESVLVRDEDCPHRREFPHDASAKRRIQRIMAAVRDEAQRAKRVHGAE